jgi:glycerol-3-phosphate dehydrogenase
VPASAVSREEIILESRSGLITIAGGKLTTHRAIAQRVVDRIMRGLGRPSGRCPTLDTPLPGARPLDAHPAGAQPEPRESLEAIDRVVGAHLVSRYGTRAPVVANLIRERAEFAEPLATGSRVIAAEVIFAVRAEMAMTVCDCLLRRMGLACSPGEARAAAPVAARLMAEECGWSATRERAEEAELIAAVTTGIPREDEA